MPSLDIGKDVICQWIRDNYPKAVILDVGACDGKWKGLLPEFEMDAVEAWEPNCIAIEPIYRTVFHKDVDGLEYGFYDLIIFGDVIEHMTVEKAQRVIEYADKRCTDMIVAVPFLYPQGAIYGNPWERHIQDDLTAEVMKKRYPSLEVLHDTGAGYCFYHKKKKRRARK